ncbi:hypothetical protein ACFVT1_23860 [Streptomyces sp. NPDC057963]|uniref:hypothetical protein n=1 Tax=Streptomyces sp. NPDC057963 TaxID=3346290 RepID=UPI0036E7AEB9
MIAPVIAVTALLAEHTHRGNCITVVATHDPAVAEAAGRIVDLARLTAVASPPARPGH